MVIGRAVMGPIMVWLALGKVAGWSLSAIVLAMLLDDIADGMVARRWGLDTPRLRLSDSCADTVFYLGTAAAVWVRAPGTLRANIWLITGLFALEGARYIFDFAKFGKAASYHSYLAKAWGLVLAIAIMCVLAWSGPGWAIGVAAVVGIVVNLEGAAMSLMLPHWQNDVKTLRVAMRIREDSKKAKAEAH
jgi:phosphatidylglycerophosphate synthase